MNHTTPIAQFSHCNSQVAGFDAAAAALAAQLPGADCVAVVLLLLLDDAAAAGT